MSERSSALSTQQLSDLARAGVVLTRHPFVEVAFEIHHIADQAGYLFGLYTPMLSGVQSDGATTDEGRDAPQVAGHENLKSKVALRVEANLQAHRDPLPIFHETLSSAAHGIGLVIRTTVRPVGTRKIDPQALPASAEAKARTQASDQAAVFDGSAQPNPSFLYESTAVLEGLVTVETEPVHPRMAHGQAIREIAKKVADIAYDARVPILALQSPAQMPHELSYEEFPTAHDWGESASLAVRFSVAIGRQSSAQRSSMCESLGTFCDKNGYGLWLTDSRLGHRSGNWFWIVKNASPSWD
jgi:hypothetical protein